MRCPIWDDATMFIRRKKNKTSTAIQLVENHRVGHTTKQRVLRHVGSARSPSELDELIRLAEVLKAEMEAKIIAKQTKHLRPSFASAIGQLSPQITKDKVDISHLEETGRYVLGIHDIYGYIYSHLGFDNLFTRPTQRQAAAKILREIVMARIARPQSKQATVEWLQTHVGVSINLNHVYQMMDKIDEGFCERIQQQALNAALNLTGKTLNVLFYDATTLYFESFNEDELKQNGYSKDMKFNQSQILLALFVTDKGLPIGYEVFPGSTFEGHTLVTTLTALKKRYKLDDVIFVADRGLFSEDNLSLLESNGFKYIVGARLKNMNKKLQSCILDENNYQSTGFVVHQRTDPNKQKEERQRIASFPVKHRYLVVHYSSRRAKKDKYDRNEAIEKLTKKLQKSKNPKSLLSNYGYKKYIDVEGDVNITLNQEKLKSAESWDGLMGVMTNISDHNPENLFKHYRSLWQIEESFRINKHDLRMRPIFHWKPHRVRAHIAIAFMAFVCVRYLETLMTIRQQKISPEQIRKTLLQVQASVIREKGSGKTFLLSSAIPPPAKTIYKAIGIKLPDCTKKIHCGA